MLDWMVAILMALRIWGYTPDYPITYKVIQEYDQENVLAYAEVRGNPIISCEVAFIEPRLKGYPDSFLQDVATHEVGHCLGMLAHLPNNKPGLMRAFISVGFSGYDRWWFWTLVKPAPFRQRLGGISYD